MQLFANNAYSVLSDGIDGVTTIIEVSSGASFPNPTGGDHFLATLIGLDVNLNETSWEIVKVTARTGNVLTVVRGQDGTAAQAWPSATRVELRVSAENLTTLRAEGGAAAPVQSVASKTGAVTLVKDDVGLGNVDNTSDAAKPVSTATQTALNAKQDTLVSGTNIKTVNSGSLLGPGNLDVLGVISEFQEFLTSGTWTKPAGATWVYVEAVGGGGGGRNNASTSTNGAFGGGGGEGIYKIFRASDVPSSVVITVGAGGAGGSTSNTDGSSGGDSSFGGLVLAYGGVGGQTNITTALLSKRGSITQFSQNYSLTLNRMTHAIGGVPCNVDCGGVIYGGGAGGGAGASAGGNYAGGISEFAGSGGTGNADAGIKAGNGVAPGGGGGASQNGGGGGDGAAGRVRVWAW